MRRLLPAAFLPDKQQVLLLFPMHFFPNAGGIRVSPDTHWLWTLTIYCVRFFSSKYSFPGFCCPGSSNTSRNILIHFYYTMSKFFLSTGQLSHERNFFIFSSFLFILSFVFYCSFLLLFWIFHFYLDFPFSYLCDALLTVLNFLFLFYILWIFKSFYLFYNFHFLFMHNILTFADCKPPFSMISYMLY